MVDKENTREKPVPVCFNCQEKGHWARDCRKAKVPLKKGSSETGEFHLVECTPCTAEEALMAEKRPRPADLVQASRAVWLIALQLLRFRSLTITQLLKKFVLILLWKT